MTTPRVAYQNWHEKHLGDRSPGDRIADAVANGMGSWRFIIIQTCIVVMWMVANILLIPTVRFDPYPFILLNLLFSTQAAYAAPVIMMSQNRAAQRDKAAAEHQYEHQELELKENTELTRQIHEQAAQIATLVNAIDKLLAVQGNSTTSQDAATPPAAPNGPGADSV